MKKKSLHQKLATHFGVKICEGTSTIINQKEIDLEERTIKAIGNTYFLIDSDQDMLVSGCSKKSINDRGPQSNATAKIKHQSDHVLNTKNVVGRMSVIDERVIDGKEVLYFESFIPATRKGDDDLVNYQEGLYDNHSIGFRYKQIELAVREGGSEMESKNWAEFYPKAINPEKADEFGFFYVVKEIELFEISVVSYGANSLTPYLGSKSIEENVKLKTEIIERLDSLNAQLKSTAESKETRKDIDLEFLQLKQIITELKLSQPSKQATQSEEPVNTDTVKEDDSKQLFKSIIKQF
jgi:phage head maturation protease